MSLSLSLSLHMYTHPPTHITHTHAHHIHTQITHNTHTPYTHTTRTHTHTTHTTQTHHTHTPHAHTHTQHTQLKHTIHTHHTHTHTHTNHTQHTHTHTNHTQHTCTHTHTPRTHTHTQHTHMHTHTHTHTHTNHTQHTHTHKSHTTHMYTHTHTHTHTHHAHTHTHNPNIPHMCAHTTHITHTQHMHTHTHNTPHTHTHYTHTTHTAAMHFRSRIASDSQKLFQRITCEHSTICTAVTPCCNSCNKPITLFFLPSLSNRLPPQSKRMEDVRDMDTKEQKKTTKHQKRRTCAIPAIRQLREHKLQSTLKHEQIPTSNFDSSTGNENKSESRKGCCKRCGANILQTADTNNSAGESSDSNEGNGNDTQEDANSFHKWCPCVRYWSHSHGKDLLTRRRQQMQRPQRKSLYHKHTVLQACFTLPWKQSIADEAASNSDWESHVDRADTPARTLHPLSDSLPRNLHQGSLNPANLRLVQPTADCTVPPSNTAIPRRLKGEHLTAEDTTAADVRGSLPPVSCFAQRKYQTNRFEKKLPLYLALHRPSPQ